MIKAQKFKPTAAKVIDINDQHDAARQQGRPSGPYQGRKGYPQAHAVRRGKPADALAAWLLAGPALLLLLVLFFLPVLAIFVIALTDWQFGTNHLSMIGLDNFYNIYNDKGFRASFLNTIIYVLIVVPSTVIISLLIALFIESGKTFRAFYRAIHFLPYMSTLAAMAIVWETLLHPTIGLVNQVLNLFGLPGVNWLRDESTVLGVLAVIGIWQNLGFAMMLFLAGLKSIPQTLYDAADIDGADGWLDRARTVTLPMLGPVFMFVVIVVSLKAFEVFDTVQILTQGGPGHSSETLLYTLYRESFVYMRTGYGACVTVVFLAMVVALTLIQARLVDKKVHYQ